MRPLQGVAAGTDASGILRAIKESAVEAAPRPNDGFEILQGMFEILQKSTTRPRQARGRAPSGIFAIEGEAQICKQRTACVARGTLFHRELRRQPELAAGDRDRLPAYLDAADQPVAAFGSRVEGRRPADLGTL